MVDIQQLVQRQFAGGADAYLQSEVHAQGASLDRLVEVVAPQTTWTVVDAAAGAGHMAARLAPHVAAVIALDLTYEMLLAGGELAARKKLKNIHYSVGDTAALPIGDSRFDLVTCRLAAHHFPNVQDFVREAYRTLKPDGLLAVVDNVVPLPTGRRKEQQEADRAGRYINAFEKLRDPSHYRALDERTWNEVFYQNCFRILHCETMEKSLYFDDWVERMRVQETDVIRLQVMMRQAPRRVKEFFKPQYEGTRLQSFSLTELIIVGKKQPLP